MKEARTGLSIHDPAEQDDPRVLAAVQEYLAALEHGGLPSRAEYLARYPEIAAALADCIDGLELVHQGALDFRQGDEPPAAAEGLVSEELRLPLGDFRILHEIGRGGMGIVYEAVQLSLGRRVAVKVLPFAAALDPTRLQRFKNEAQAAAQLHHTNIVPVYAVGSARGVHFYAMQLIEGQSLAAVIGHLQQLSGKLPDETLTHDAGPGVALHEVRARRAAGPGDVTEALAHVDTKQTVRLDAGGGGTSGLTAEHSDPPQYFRTVARLIQRAAAALEHAHRSGVIHRDIKPANLLLDQNGDIWITDFGLAQFQEDAELTRTGDLLGTLRYMSPEQTAGNRVVLDHRTDIYSLGVTLYELLTLEPAVVGGDRQTLTRRILEEEPRAPRLLNKAIPVELETIVLKAISKGPGDRYASSQGFADDLRNWLEDKPILARRPTLLEHAARWRRRHRGLVKSGLAFLVLALLGLLTSTIVIAHEQSKTQSAYEREIAQRTAAEESFRQARQAVDAFTQLGEEELAPRPSMHQLRRKFLETALDYYKNFLNQRQDDESARAELAATSNRVASIVEELSALDSFTPFMLLSDKDVRQDLKLSQSQSERLTESLARLWTDWEKSTAQWQRATLEKQQSQLASLLRGHRQEFESVLTAAQVGRLGQISLQQKGPFAFKTPELVAALQLNAEQRHQINEIIEMTGPHRQRREQDGHGPPDHEPPDHGDDDGPGDHHGLPDDHGPGDRHGPGGDRGYGPGDHRHGPGRDHGPEEDHGPGDAHGPGGHHGPGDNPLLDVQAPGGLRPHHSHGRLRRITAHTLEEILGVLTAKQAETWHDLTGEPFASELSGRPDE